MRSSQAESYWYGERGWVMGEVLYSCIVFIHSDIFPTYSSWRYESIQDRLDIGLGVLNICNLILSDYTWGNPEETNNSLTSVREYLISGFLDSKRSYHLSSLLDILAIGNGLSTGFYLQNQFNEANSVESMVEAALELLERLVSIRINTKRPISFLELTIIDHSVDSSLSSRFGRENIEIIQIIGRYTGYDYNIDIPKKSADVLKMMAVVLQESSLPSSSFVGYFGEDAKSIVSSMIYLLKEELLDQNSTLQSAIYSCLSVILSAQPGLASMFLLNEKKEKELFFEGTLNGIILNGLNKWEKMIATDSKTFSLMLKVLVVLFHNVSQYGNVVAKWLESEILWDTLEAIINSEHLKTVPKDDLAICYRDFIKGHIMHILALSMHASKIMESRGSKIPNKIYSITRSVLGHGIKGFFSPCMEGLYVPYLPELEVWVRDQLSALDGLIELRSLRIPSWNDEIGRDHGICYIYDPFLLQDKLGVDAENLIFSGLCQLNLSFSRMDAFLYKLKGWKDLIEIVTISSLDKVWEKENPVGHGGSEQLLEILDSILNCLKSESKEGYPMDVFREDLSELIVFIIGKTAQNKVIPGVLLKKFASQLVIIQECMRVDILKLGPIGHFSAYRFHLNLLLSSLIILRSCNLLVKPLTTTKSDSLEMFINDGLEISFPVVATGLSHVLRGLLARMTINTDDLSLLLILLTEMVRSSISRSPDTWIPVFERNRIVELLGVIFSQSLLIPNFPLIIAEHILEFFLALSKDPLVAELLAVNGIISIFANNCFTDPLVEGKMEQYQFHEENIPHKIWCLMLSVTANMLLHLGHSNQFIEEVYGFIRLYQNQILSSFKLSPLTFSNVMEVLKVSEMFYGLARAQRGMSSSDVLCGYQDFGLRLLGNISFIFRSPNEFQKSAQAISLHEKSLSESALSTSEENTKSQFLLTIELQLIYLCRNLLAHFRCTTRADDILSSSIPATEICENIFQMTMQSHGIQGCSIGSLFDIVRYLSSLLFKKLENKSVCLVRENTLAFTIESCLVLIVTQIALLCSMDGLDISLLREIRNELNQSLQELVQIYKRDENQIPIEVWDVSKSLNLVGSILSFSKTF